ncbi:hypothetical protein SPRG_03599 [Saprolegnia parasitica CBS 223.65]|uniref:PPM-type phosphatase domain-containing protein n=1 Tax=Saprolegnia parasitica (strain CBS 223.65) TaxID=695850 RepID=A0A067CYX0_SAPPC|nr:hypothetical protein SPRG_03599 [Saprolegnia parasitica CBS 223.65]KDO31681.1 hypothetical protein SPRG_03599 [Saprolegnia parasitica CBS 223.65]|eukprot:XP_012197567.1 hypothetical protein SPRG_03599 [Saprolegnia parasitica CBS 223.65]
MTTELAAGVATDKGPKRTQEDAYYIGGYKGRLTLNGFSGTGQVQELGCYGIFDGHGGERASRYTAEYIFPKILSHMEGAEAIGPFAAKCTIEDAIKKGIHELDADFCSLSNHCKTLSLGHGAVRQRTVAGIEDGSTCLVAIVRNGVVYVGNVGDSRAVLVKEFPNGKIHALPLSQDHKPEVPAERQRIEAAGGEVTGLVYGQRAPEFALSMWPFNRVVDVPRVNGILSMSRAIGDASLKPIISADADVTVHVLTAADKYLILACDGLWDVVSNTKAAKLAAKCATADAAAATLCKHAISHGTEDNVTVIVVDLRGCSAVPESPANSVVVTNSHSVALDPHAVAHGPPRTQSLPRMK